MVMGSVINQVITIFPAVPQFTEENRFEEPTPITEEVITWVVLTGAPLKVAISMTAAAAI